MSVLWVYYDHIMTNSQARKPNRWFSENVSFTAVKPMVLRWRGSVYEYIMSILWVYCEYIMGILWVDYVYMALWVYYEYIMIIVWVYCEYITNVLRSSYEQIMSILWVYDD